jgi:sulfate permease, SulP family
LNRAKFAAFNPRLLADLQGYSLTRFLKDAGAGATVGVVALPLAMAFAIASGLKPEAGLWTAIIAGFLISALGGSSVQIGGPAGAFIVIVAGILAQYGLANLLIATGCAGLILFLMGLLKLGRLVRLVPISVILGFTNGIAVLIALSQVRDWMGLSVAQMPADFFNQIGVMWAARGSFNPYAFGLGSLSVVGLFIWPKLFAIDSRFRAGLEKLDTFSALRATSAIPGPVVALLTLSVLTWALALPVETIGSRFGGIASGLPPWNWPSFSWATVKLLVSPTLTIAMLGALESLLCARVADQISTLRKHDPDQELMAQGVANMVVPFFGGMPATGTIARTVTNIRAGATSPVAGMVHALTLAAMVLIAAPLAAQIPLAVLAGILLFVAWNMGEWSMFARLTHHNLDYRLKFLATFLITVVFDLTLAMEIGLGLAFVMFTRRISTLFTVTVKEVAPDQAVAQITGSLFFGTVPKMDPVIERVQSAAHGFALTLDLAAMDTMDGSGLDVLETLQKTLHAKGGTLLLRRVPANTYDYLQRTHFLELPGVRYPTA